MRYWIAIVILFFSLQHSFADESQPDPVQVRLIHEEETIQPGRPFWVAIYFKLNDHWHTYWKNPGDAGMASSVEWSLPQGFTASPLLWPAPKRFTTNGMVGYGYDNEVLLLSQITPPATIKEPFISLDASVNWLVCSDDFCLPGQSTVTLSLPISEKVPTEYSQWIAAFQEARRMLPQKPSHLKVHQVEDQIQIELPSIVDKPFGTTYFSPNESDVIDHKVEGVLTKEPSSYYTLQLKATKPNGKPSLQGVVVVMDPKDPSRIAYAIDVDAPIEQFQKEEGLISMAETGNQQQVATTLTTLPATLEGGLLMALVLALVGGIILNLMPCVLPVISIKIFSFVKMAGENRSLILKHGVAFSAGVIVSFWLLAGVLLSLKAYGHAVGWGFQLQEPLFVASLAAILFVLGLNLFGVFEIGASVTNWAGQLQRKQEGVVGSFCSGVLATAVATPCTGPFLGSAVGFAFAVPTIQAMSIFTSLGVGMALPYLLLSAYPGLLRYIPKPGAWMDTFKQLMGFLMFGTVVWLLWVFGAQTSSLAMTLVLAGLMLISIACWMFGKWGTVEKDKNTRLIAICAAAFFIAFGGYALYQATSSALVTQENVQEAGWETFSPQKVKDLQAKGIPVFVDFTAKWCLICQANHLVLSSSSVQSKFKELGVVTMKADWTKPDPVITQELLKHGRNSVPLYLYYGTDSSQGPKILPQVLTPEIVIQYLNDV